MPESAGRLKQRHRTRKALLQAAARLMRDGRKPTLEEAAEEAMVSRATAYRYFPNIDVLILEAAIDVQAPAAEELFGDSAPLDAASRVELVDASFDRMIRDNEPQLRLLLARSLENGLRTEGNTPKAPSRQNRRLPLIQEALAPIRQEISPTRFRNLALALSMIIGTEGMVVSKDVLRLSDAEARKVRRWAIQALINAARGT